MAKGASGKGSAWFPANTAGIDQRAWQGEGTATDAEGVVFTRLGHAVKAPGLVEYTTWSAGNPFTGGRPYNLGVYVREGVSDLVIVHGGKISLLQGVGLFELTDARHVPASPLEADRLHQFDNILIICNGRDPNLKWDGRHLTPLGIHSAPAAPHCYLVQDPDNQDGLHDEGSILKADSDYEYLFYSTWVNARGQESESSPASNKLSDKEVTYDAGQDKNYAILVITDAEKPSDDIVGRYIYRSTDGGVTRYFLRRIPGTYSNQYLSHEEPGEEGDGSEQEAEGQNTPPPVADWCFGFRGRVYYKPASSSNVIHYSEVNAPEKVPLLNLLEVNAADGGRLTGWGVGHDFAAIFTDSAVFMLTHDRSGDPLLRPVSTSEGAVNDRAVVSFNGTIYFLGEHGIYSFDGALVRPVTDRIQNLVDALPRAHLKQAFGWVDRKERRVMFAVAAGPGPEVNEIVVLHTETGALSRIVGVDLGAATVYEGEQILAAKSGSDHELAVWGATDSLFGGNFTGEFRTAWIHLSDPDSDKTFTRVDVHYVQTGSASVNVTLESFLDWDDRSAVSSTTFTPNDPDADVWGTGNWGSGEWDSQRIRTVRVDLQRTDTTDRTRVTGKALQLRFATTVKDAPWKIIGFRLYYEGHGQRQEGVDL